MSDHRALIEEAKEKDLERRFGSWQDLDLNADGTEPDPIENIVTDAFALIARLADALERRTTHPEWMSDAGKAFRERFIGSPDANTFTPLGFFEAGAEWAASTAEHERDRALEQRDQAEHQRDAALAALEEVRRLAAQKVRLGMAADTRTAPPLATTVLEDIAQRAAAELPGSETDGAS